MKRWLISGMISVVLAAPSVVWADVISPEEEECSGKEAGDSCSGGTCQEGERCRATPDGPADCSPTLECEPSEEGDSCAQAGDAGLPVLSMLAGLALVGLVRRRRAGDVA